MKKNKNKPYLILVVYLCIVMRIAFIFYVMLYVGTNKKRKETRPAACYVVQ